MGRASLYRIFNGRTEDLQQTVDLEAPKELHLLGRAVSIVYESDKKNGVDPKFAGQLNLFEHKFGKNVLLWTDETGETLYISGGTMHVEKAGIIH